MDTVRLVMMSEGRRRRFWSLAEKRRIVAESFEDGVSVSAVARRHDINANLLFTWRRDPRLGGRRATSVLLPVEVCEEDAPTNVSVHDDGGPDAMLPAGTEVDVHGLHLRFKEPVSTTALVQLEVKLRRAA